MLVNLNDQESSSKGALKLFAAPLPANNLFNKKAVKEMVRAYRVANKGGLKYAHFKVAEVLKLFIVNKVLDPKKTVEDQLTAVENYGMKIYLGTHISDDTLSHITDPRKKAKYIGKTTTILCNTNISTDPTHDALFKDILDDIVAIAVGDNYGSALDQAETAPPYHDGAPEDEDHDAGYPL